MSYLHPLDKLNRSFDKIMFTPTSNDENCKISPTDTIFVENKAVIVKDTLQVKNP